MLRNVLCCTADQQIATALQAALPEEYNVQWRDQASGITLGKVVADCVVVDMSLHNADVTMREANAAGCCRISIVPDFEARNLRMHNRDFDSFQSPNLDIDVLAARVVEGTNEATRLKAKKQVVAQ